MSLGENQDLPLIVVIEIVVEGLRTRWIETLHTLDGTLVA
jgi:hypothetical protein